jgi:hypothetical protein
MLVLCHILYSQYLTMHLLELSYLDCIVNRYTRRWIVICLGMSTQSALIFNDNDALSLVFQRDSCVSAG